MTAPHLDDEDLSAHLDGAPADRHLGSCTVCSDRLAALRVASDAVAAAWVEPLPRAVIDAMVARAMTAADTAPPVSEGDGGAIATAVAAPAGLAARRRLQTPPPTWLITAAAAIAALAGIAGLLRAGADSSPSNLADAGGGMDAQSLESSGGSDEDQLSGSASGAPKVAGKAVDPEVVQIDLGDQDDPAALTALLSSGGRNSFAADQSQTATPARPESSATASDADGPPPPSPTTTAARVDRARCRAEAERIGAGSFARLLSTSTVRWKATAAEVLVFSLTESRGGVSRQAMVLARSNCALLADPRF